jgi:hypothetical protein
MDVHTSDPIIADRAEFADALDRLRRGHTLVRVGKGSCGCVLDGGIVHHSFDVLLRYGLIETFDNREGFSGISYYRITDEGRRFADRVWQCWRSRPPLQRLMVRLTG